MVSTVLAWGCLQASWLLLETSAVCAWEVKLGELLKAIDRFYKTFGSEAEGSAGGFGIFNL